MNSWRYPTNQYRNSRLYTRNHTLTLTDYINQKSWNDRVLKKKKKCTQITDYANPEHKTRNRIQIRTRNTQISAHIAKLWIRNCRPRGFGEIGRCEGFTEMRKKLMQLELLWRWEMVIWGKRDENCCGFHHWIWIFWHILMENGLVCNGKIMKI